MDLVKTQTISFSGDDHMELLYPDEELAPGRGRNTAAALNYEYLSHPIALTLSGFEESITSIPKDTLKVQNSFS